MDDKEKRREYARQYRERNRELLRAKARAYHASKPKRAPRPRPTTEERFWAKVQRGGPDECWEWQAGTSYGYGSFRVGGRAVAAHRYSWELHNGPIPPGKHALHHCDNPPCVNPSHLYIGTDVENARDRVDRGRAKGGYAGRVPRPPGWNRKVRPDDRRGGTRKLTPVQVAEIRRLYFNARMSQRWLAEQFGVSHPTIGQVVRREGVYQED